jgi:hypothetical protein
VDTRTPDDRADAAPMEGDAMTSFVDPLEGPFDKGRLAEVEYEGELESEGVGEDDTEYVMEEVADPEDDQEEFGGR